MGLVRVARQFFDRSGPSEPDALKRAKPLRNPDVLQDLADDGTVMLMAPLAQQGNGLAGFLARWMKAPDHKKFELEPVGAFVWNLCDGRHTFEGISKRLREEFKMNRIEADAALLAFLQMLSQRKLISLAPGKKS